MHGLIFLFVLLVLTAGTGAPVRAGEAVLVVDANAGAVLHQEHATVRLHPASLTKMMTAYLAFDAFAKGRMAVDEKLNVSARAAHQGGHGSWP